MRGKPIRVFWSPLTRRFWATRAWKEISPGLIECTGEKFDVTNDIAGIMEREEITFRRVENALEKIDKSEERTTSPNRGVAES